MGNYTEPDLIETFERLAKLYAESYPNDREAVERFMRWAHAQYGYEYK